MEFALKVRIPAWSSIEGVTVNKKKAEPRISNGYLTLQRKWKPEDKIGIQLAMPLRTEERKEWIGDDPSTDYSKVSLWKGPRQLVYDQEHNQHLWEEGSSSPSLLYSHQTYDDLHFNESVQGTPLKIGSRNYAKGLGVRSVSELVYSLGGEFKEFLADIGIDECAGDEGRVRFRVCVDGVMRMCDGIQGSFIMEDGFRNDSQYGIYADTLCGKDESITIRVNLENAQGLRSVVDEFIITNLKNDYADWADARLVRGDGSFVYLSDLKDDRERGLPSEWGKVQLKEIKDTESPSKVVLLAYHLGEAVVSIRLNYLADLGYGLYEHRPVLNSWMKVKD